VLFALFSNNILPIFIAAGAGYLAAKYLKVTPRSVSQIAFYIFSPCLIFNLPLTQLSGQDVTPWLDYDDRTHLALTGLIGWMLRLGVASWWQC
jgi:predicted permease